MREHEIHNIGSDDKEKFERYLDYLVSLIRVVGGKAPSTQGRLGSVQTGLVVKPLCKFFSNGQGCKWGRKCTNRHETEIPGACYTCGQVGHQAHQCAFGQTPASPKGGKKGQKADKAEKGKGAGKSDSKGRPSAAAAVAQEADASAEAGVPEGAEKKARKRAAAAAKKAQVEETTMRDTLQRLLAKTGRVVVQAARATNDAGASTFDSGASTMFRHALPNEDRATLSEVDVELAMGEKGKALIDKAGDVVTDGPQLRPISIIPVLSKVYYKCMALHIKDSVNVQLSVLYSLTEQIIKPWTKFSPFGNSLKKQTNGTTLCAIVNLTYSKLMIY